jgi:hypothetical protein
VYVIDPATCPPLCAFVGSVRRQFIQQSCTPISNHVAALQSVDQ